MMKHCSASASVTFPMYFSIGANAEKPTVAKVRAIRQKTPTGATFMTVMVISIMTSLNWLIKLETTEARVSELCQHYTDKQGEYDDGKHIAVCHGPIGVLGMMLSSVSTRLTLESAAVEDRSGFLNRTHVKSETRGE